MSICTAKCAAARGPQKPVKRGWKAIFSQVIENVAKKKLKNVHNYPLQFAILKLRG